MKKIFSQILEILFNKKYSSESATKNSEKSNGAVFNKCSGKSNNLMSLKFNMPEDIINALKDAINKNVLLVKSIPSDHLMEIADAILCSITIGNGLADLVPEIAKHASLEEARLIANDQTKKAYNHLDMLRMKSVGIKQFKWLHSGGGQYPRKSHISMSGKLYSFDSLPIINQEEVASGDEEPRRGIPGDAEGCNCTMVPEIEFGEKD